MPAPQREEFEPADKPVRFYETMLCATADALLFVDRLADTRVVELAATAPAVVLIAVSLWRLLVPPRFSVTRCAFVLVGLLCLVLLFTRRLPKC